MRLMFLFACLALCMPADGGSYAFRDGYYWSGGQAYTRRSVSYWHHGRWCQRYEYSLAPVIEKIVTKKEIVEKLVQDPEKYDLDSFRLEALRIAAEAAEHRAKTREAQAIVDLLDGVAPGVGESSGYGQYGYRIKNTREPLPIADQGSTLYGVTSLSSTYPEMDLTVHLNQVNQLAQSALQLSGQSMRDFNDAVTGIAALQAEAKGQQLKTAEILAVGHVISEGIRSLDQVRSTTEIEVNPSHGSDTGVDGDVVAGDVEPVFQRLSAVVASKCVFCHGSQDPKGGYSFEGSAADMQAGLSIKDLKAMLASVTDPDPEKRMPKGGDLSESERRVFLDAYLEKLKE